MSLFQGTVILGTAFEVTQRYTDLVPIGTGVSGLVCSANDLITKNVVAVKKLSDPFRTAAITQLLFREIRLLRHLKHENVVNLTDIFVSPSEDIYLVTEHMRTDLSRGLKYIHSAGVVHRDLKPSNLLINENCDLKICDFGLARVQELRMTGYISTRYYRAPEVMLSWQHYNEKVDIWSAGCIFAEMLLGKPLFPGNDHVHQFKLITETLGKPPSDVLGKIKNLNTLGFINSLPDYKPKAIADLFPGCDPNAIKLLNRIFVFDPQSRPTAKDILESPFLAPYHDPTDEPTAVEKLDWSFLKEEHSLDTWKLKMYGEVLGYHERVTPPQGTAKLQESDLFEPPNHMAHFDMMDTL
ncbi:mitogen-activated protein kinase HOG1 [Aspergillus campestris IBT 28561]|uniref:mitogen-activated protein kinase n=1 Tax=Aspergillus campestris (strain IBT 28561) TaxID=1392248 RepID=A0A2I1CXJ3_ASPC2|nr:mitogen-activated protein kinase HOG1 [Aspergillus campestris IBT 28561]PKY02340.1 mitogen-activated protein kinase HOG1 [Aspergillus campestris IBT 28561]